MCGSDYSSTTTTDRPTTWVVFSPSSPPFLSTLFRCSIPIPHQQPPPFPLAVSLAHRFVQSSQSVILMLEHSLMRTTLHVQFSFEWLGKWTLIGNIFVLLDKLKSIIMWVLIGRDLFVKYCQQPVLPGVPPLMSNGPRNCREYKNEPCPGNLISKGRHFQLQRIY